MNIEVPITVTTPEPVVTVGEIVLTAEQFNGLVELFIAAGIQTSNGVRLTDQNTRRIEVLRRDDGSGVYNFLVKFDVA